MKTILIVEDMAIFREPLEAVLRREGYRVVCAADGQEGLAAMAGEVPAAVLLDLSLPVMSGQAMLAKMRENPRLARVPVVVLSAAADRDRIVEAVRLGISSYMLKSQFSLRTMLERLRQAIGEGEGAESADRVPGAPQPGETGSPEAEPAALALPRAIAQARRIAGAPGRAGAAAASPAQAAAPAALSMAGPATPPVDLAGGLKGLRPMLTRSDLLAKVDASAQLKALTPTVAQVLKLTASDRTSIETVSRAIAQDQAIALKILKLSNSAAYTRGEPVDSVQKAVVRIGLDRIRQAVLNLAVIDQFTSAAFQGPLNTLQFWEHAIATGLIAAELAHAQGEKEADAAFTMGLLHDVGRIIYAEQLGPAYVEVIHAAQALGAPLEQVESRLLLMSHADVMDRILHAWGFANHLVNPIVHHHLSPANARNVAPKQLTEILRLGLADRLAHALLLGASGNDTIYPIDEHCQALRLDGAAIQRVEETARTETDNMKFTMLSNTSGAPWPKRRDELRSMLNAPFRPLFVSAEPRVDSYRMFCDALADPGGEEPPNVAIVHLAAGRDRAGVSQALLAAERERGVQELPAVVLSPGAKLTLEGPAATRRSELLATPVQAQRLLDAVGMLLEGRAAWAA